MVSKTKQCSSLCCMKTGCGIMYAHIHSELDNQVSPFIVWEGVHQYQIPLVLNNAVWEGKKHLKARTKRRKKSHMSNRTIRWKTKGLKETLTRLFYLYVNLCKSHIMSAVICIEMIQDSLGRKRFKGRKTTMIKTCTVMIRKEKYNRIRGINSLNTDPLFVHVIMIVNKIAFSSDRWLKGHK